MKIKDQLVEDGDKVIHARSYDFQWAIDAVKKNSGINAPDPAGDWRHVGHIPKELLAIWVKEAGIKWSDTGAVKDLIRKKLLSGEYSNLRPWQGTF